MARRKAPHLPDNLLDQLLAGGDARAALDPGGLLDDLKKALAQALNGGDTCAEGLGTVGNFVSGWS